MPGEGTDGPSITMLRSMKARASKSRKPKDKRRERRLGAAMRVRLGQKTGTTRDLSASGVFFETEAAYHKGSRIHFEINLDTPWGKAICDCEGKIVRVERRDGAVGIAVQFSAERSDASGRRRASGSRRHGRDVAPAGRGRRSRSQSRRR